MPDLACPRCPPSLLAPARMGDVEVQECAHCNGIAVAINRMVPLLEQVGAALAGEIDPDSAIEPVPADAVVAACPSCGDGMEPFGYMGMDIAVLDRCSPCALLWLDPDELGAAAMLLLRTHARNRDRVRASEAATATIRARIEVARSVRRTLKRMRRGGI